MNTSWAGSTPEYATVWCVATSYHLTYICSHDRYKSATSWSKLIKLGDERETVRVRMSLYGFLIHPYHNAIFSKRMLDVQSDVLEN